MILPRLVTPLTPAEAQDALREGYRAITGEYPSANVLALLMAQSSLETDRWRAMQHWNFGMVKAAGYPTVFLLRDDCGDDDCEFRAYSGKLIGARDYIQQLKYKTHWWTGLHTGTPEGFNQGLITPPRYYSSKNTSGYENTLRVRSIEFGGSASVPSPFPPSDSSGGSAAGVMLLVVAGVGGAYAISRRRKRR